MTLTNQEAYLLTEYADIFNVNASEYADMDEEAYVILAHLYGLFAIEGTYERMRYRNAVLAETGNVFGTDTRFFYRIQVVAADNAAGLNWYPQRSSNEDLIKEFKNLTIGLYVLMTLGISPVGGTIRRGVEERIRPGKTTAEAIARARRRLIQGAGSGMIEAMTERLATRFPIGIALVAAATIAFFAMEIRIEKIREIMNERFEADLATEDELEEISNANIMDLIKEKLDEYW